MRSIELKTIVAATGQRLQDNVVTDTTSGWDSFLGAQRRVKRRNTVLLEKDAAPDLSYFSTTRLIQNPDKIYAQFPNAGRGVGVYIIDDSAVPTQRQSTANNVIKECIYALGSSPHKPDKSNHGNRLASKVGGIFLEWPRMPT